MSTINILGNKLKYAPTHCETTGDNQGDYRFTIEQKGSKMIFIIGLNPSTANEIHIDPTIRKLLLFVERVGYNGFVMMNLCAQRQTKPNNLPQEQEHNFHKKALKIIKKIGERYPKASVLGAFFHLYACLYSLKRFYKLCLGQHFATHLSLPTLQSI